MKYDRSATGFNYSSSVSKPRFPLTNFITLAVKPGWCPARYIAPVYPVADLLEHSLVRSERTLTYADSKAAAISWNTRRRRQGRKTRDTFRAGASKSCSLRCQFRDFTRKHVLNPNESLLRRDCLIFERPGKSPVCRARVFPRTWWGALKDPPGWLAHSAARLCRFLGN